LETLLAEGYLQRGDTARAAALGTRVAVEAEAIGRRDLRGRVLLLVAHDIWVGQGEASDKNRAVGLLAQAVDDLHTAGDLAHEAEVRIFQGYDGWWDGDVERAAGAWTDAAAVAHEAGDAGRETRALIMECRARVALGQLAEVEALTRRAVELAPTTSRLTQSKVWQIEAEWLWNSGTDLERARSLLAEASQVAEEADDFSARYIALMRLVEINYEAGDLETAAGRLEVLVEMVESVNHLGWIPEAHRLLAQVLVEMGDVAGAEVHALRAVEAVAADDMFSVASSKMALGIVRDHQGRTDEAGTLLREAVAIAHSLTFRTEQSEFELPLGTFQLAHGQTAEGEATLAGVRRRSTELFGPKCPFLGLVDRQEAAARARATPR
jgi:tetratricopeptide (TPR) repeat protein